MKTTKTLLLLIAMLFAVAFIACGGGGGGGDGTPSGGGGGPTSVNLPKTGQTTCYDAAGVVVACANTGQDGELQKGVAWPSPRFTDNGNGTVTDNLTGLMWTQNASVPTVGACTGGVRTWQEALDYVACLNTNNYLGYTDWRLPNRKELRSPINYGQANTATWLNTQGFSNVQADGYWSSSTYASNPTDAWRVVMWGGTVYGYSKTNTYYVWPVRAGQ